MLKTKLYRAVNSLERVELNRLAKFIFGQLPLVASELLGLLILNHRNRDAVPSKIEVWKDLGEPGDFEDARFRKICTDALQMLARFLSIEYYFADPLQEASIRLMALSRKDMEPLYRTQLNRVETLMNRLPEQGAAFYYQKYQVEQHKYRMSQANLQRFEVTNIEQILLNLDTFYVIEKLRYYCEILSRKTFVLHDYKNRLMEEILALVADDDLISAPVVNIYHKIVLTHLHPSEDRYYFELKDSVQKQAQHLPAQHRKRSL